MENDQAIGKSAITPFHANTEAEKKSIEKVMEQENLYLDKLSALGLENEKR